jgi:glutamate synthase (NADPH/NADH) large chain
MASDGHEPVGSMGNDAPPAVFSKQPQLFYNYFRQMFAQVTNPPMDPIREDLVMSLMTFIGNRADILSETPQNSRLIKLRHPFLSNEDLFLIRNLHLKDFSATILKIAFPAGGKGKDLEDALENLCRAAEKAIGDNHKLIILSDRHMADNEVPIPALLAVSAVNQHLIARGLRTGAGLILETGEAREVMHFALLFGFGATAVNPYLAFEAVAAMAINRELSKPAGVTQAIDNYISALGKGLLKIMSKMGICTLRSYRGAQVFEAFGIGHDMAKLFLGGITSRLDGIGLDRVAADAKRRHDAAINARLKGEKLLPSGGVYQLRADGEKHFWNPASIAKLQQATRNNDDSMFREYCRLSDEQPGQAFTLRSMFNLKETTPVPLDEVEPAENIVKRFVTGAMSFGSISKEAHETIALAMNSLQAKSNCGEGGEDPARYRRMPGGLNLCSAIKQVASGRFGVSTEYLVNASDLQIKIAQGAKPGEGGQLPGHKVNAEIARVRHSTPGVTLISPPPHHDIYSIEDLSQLIYDLKNVNPAARISVKLVSELGVGTIAAGVAKAKADVIVISGGDGGTGASPLSSIKYAGMPWEIGLLETQRILMENNLRDRVRLQVDGQMRTGRDVVIAALLGAEEYGFATAALVVCGCVMMRKCHSNSCPVGVATQDPRLRKFFSGKPEYLVNFFMMIARQAREILSRLGLRSLDEAIGRPDLLEIKNESRPGDYPDFSALLPGADFNAAGRAQRCTQAQDHGLEKAFDAGLIAMVEPHLKNGTAFAATLPIKNIHRSAGTMLAGRLARDYGNSGLAEDRITCRFNGSAGQSFGAFAVKGMTFILDGEANDYVGKGLSGGRIIIRPPPGAGFDPALNIIAGNTILYGATAGEAYINGAVGERFAVRNSGANAVVEGVGDHGCEYMTGGRIVVLGDTGLNFAAGMSGGLAYVLDINRRFDINCNLNTVDLESLTDPVDISELRGLIEKHLRHTGSPRAADILDNWEARLPYFVKVFPMEYRRALGRMSLEDEATEREVPVHG